MIFGRCLLAICILCFPMLKTLAAQPEDDRPRYVQMLQIKSTAYKDSIRQSNRRKVSILAQPARIDSKDLLKDLSALLTFQDRLQINIDDRENDLWLAELGATATDVLKTVSNINGFLEKHPPYWGLFFQRIFRLQPKLLERRGEDFIHNMQAIKDSDPIVDDSGKTIIIEFEIFIQLANLMKSAGLFNFQELGVMNGVRRNENFLSLLKEMNQSPRCGIWSAEFLNKLIQRMRLKNEYQLELARDLLFGESGNPRFQLNDCFYWDKINHPGQLEAVLALNSASKTLPTRFIEPIIWLVLAQPCEGAAVENFVAYCSQYDNWRIKDTLEALNHILVDLPRVTAVSTSAEVSLWSAFSHHTFLDVPPSQLAKEVELMLKKLIPERKSVHKTEEESEVSLLIKIQTPELQRLVKNAGAFAIDCLHHFSESETKLLAEKITTPEVYDFCAQMMKENINPIHLLSLIDKMKIQLKKGEWMYMFRFLKSNNSDYAACLARQAKGRFKTPLKAAITLGTYHEFICQQVADDQNRLLNEIKSTLADSTNAELVEKIRARIALLVDEKDWDFDIDGECTFCREETDLSNPLVRFHEGSCGFCWDCMKGILESNVNSGIAECPCLDEDDKKCSMLLPHSYIDPLLADIDPKTKINFYRRTVLALASIYAELYGHTKFQICPNNRCFKLLRGTSEVVDCSDCGESHCFTCDQDHTAESNCDDYRKWLQENSEKLPKRKIFFAMFSSKKCPGCKERITKGEGCNHMTCLYCGYEFHWDTLEPYRQGIQ